MEDRLKNPKKRQSQNGGERSTAPTRAKKIKTARDVQDEERLTESDVEQLGEEIPKSPKNYNAIATLLRCANGKDNLATPALVSLCRAFSLLWVQGRFSLSKNANANERTVIEWLKSRSGDFEKCLAERIHCSRPPRQQQSITLYMQLVKSQLASGSPSWVEAWTGKCYFRDLVSAILSCDNGNATRIFAEEYVNNFADVKYYTLNALSRILNEYDAKDTPKQILNNTVTLIQDLKPPTSSSGDVRCIHEYSIEQHKFKKPPLKPSEMKKQAQIAFLKLLAQDLSLEHRKSLLNIITPVVVPHLQNPALVLDFLTDSFNTGGSTSLLALSGLYELMTKHNFDYPSFYPKLYSLLDDNLLHSAHRSQFFRLLNQFLESSHLPAAMVASFLKRLSRLALHGPPGAIVAVVPWVYNMLKTHPSCTFMIHRELRCKEERDLVEFEGAEDPFDMSEMDPMATGAIDSCLWELDTLQQHFHPNVASLAQILSQEFRKQYYSLEDFLDHSYSSLVSSEMGKEMKKAPVVEFEIPRQVFTSSSGDETLAHLMTEILA